MVRIAGWQSPHEVTRGCDFLGISFGLRGIERTSTVAPTRRQWQRLIAGHRSGL